jgi:hypothetical protein
MAADVAGRLAAVKVAAIYASPLERAMRSRLRNVGRPQLAISLQAQGMANGCDYSIAGQIPRR